jgi:hypothetical protein
MSELIFDKLYPMSELCEILNLPYDSKHSKYSFSEIEKTYAIEKKSRYKYSISRELSTEEKIDAIVYGKNKQLLRPIIITTLAKKKDNRIQKRMKEYLHLFGIVNDNFAPFTWENRNIALVDHLCKINLDEQKIDDFISEVNPMLKRMVKDIWEEMENDDLIEKIEHPYFVERIIFEDQLSGKRMTRKQSHKCNNDERERLMATKKEVAIEMGYNNSNEVPFIRKQELSGNVSRKLGILYYYEEYELILNREWLGKSEYCLEDISFHKKLINENVIRKTLTSNQGKLKQLSDIDRMLCVDTVIKLETDKIKLYTEEYLD